MPNDMMIAALRKNRLNQMDKEGGEEAHEGPQYDPKELCDKMDELEGRLSALEKAYGAHNSADTETGDEKEGYGPEMGSQNS